MRIISEIVCPGVILLGEVVMEPSRVVPYFGYLTGHGAGAVGRGELYNSNPASGDARLCGTTASLCGLEKALYEQDARAIAQAVQYDIMLHAYMLVQSGISVLYSGDEIGQINDYSYHENPDKCEDSRYLHRGTFRWDLEANITNPETSQYQIFKALQKLETFRSSHKVFGTEADTRTIDTFDDSVLALVRRLDNEKLVALFNFSDCDKIAWIREDDGVFTDVMTGAPMEAKDVRIPAGSFYWLYRDEKL